MRSPGPGVAQPTAAGDPPSAGVPASRWAAVLVWAAVVAVAFNLRTAITVVGPLIPLIREDLGASNVLLGLVGTIPVLAFGLVAPAAPVLNRRFGLGRSLAGSLVLLAAAIALRSAGGVGWLLVGTALLGVAIAIGNVLLPALVKARFADRASMVTSAYTATMVLAATVSAGVAVPLADARSWEVSAGIWAVPSLLGALVVAAAVIASGRLAPPGAGTAPAAAGLPTAVLYRSRLAWTVTAFMGLQSTLFYVTIAWLPDIFLDRGMDVAAAGAMVSVLNVAGLVGVLAIPTLSRGRADQRRSAWASGVCCVGGAALLLVPGTGAAPIASAVLGLGLGATIGLALSFFALRTATPADAAALSGMAQTWGYLLAAGGPVAWGALRDATGSWTAPVLLLLLVAVAASATCLAAARDETLTA
jgi:MFS transporter, CP family, cyanate transporter